MEKAVMAIGSEVCLAMPIVIAYLTVPWRKSLASAGARLA